MEREREADGSLCTPHRIALAHCMRRATALVRSLATAQHASIPSVSSVLLSSGLFCPPNSAETVSGAAQAMATAGKVLREWRAPPGAAEAGPAPLLLQNSFLDEKVPFVPAAGPDSKQITWYACGPTVYDVAHMGHARNYLTFDIIRRVLEDYFGYNLLMVMNVTDVDDKIILRARRNYLLAQYKDAGKPAAEVGGRCNSPAGSACHQALREACACLPTIAGEGLCGGRGAGSDRQAG